MKAITAIAALLLAAPAQASEIYLNCDRIEREGPYIQRFHIDTSKLTAAVHQGMVNYPGFPKPNTHIWPLRVAPEAVFIDSTAGGSYVIDRRTLTVRYVYLGKTLSQNECREVEAPRGMRF